ncbi:glycoside hydrolase family 3 protein [Atractiella rhizophila]|nr:glycoside hydrolase family 3 protein [Atractiella rhizophila]
MDPVALLDQLTTEEKIQVLSGDDNWHLPALPRFNIPRVRTSDGPNGVRGIAWSGGAAASCFPCGTGLGASFDEELMLRVGKALGEECRARGVHCLLGPTINLQRHPGGGRGFESYSEDPFLAGRLAMRWIEGVQSCKVMTNFIANEQEHHRRSNNSVVDLRTLHELYAEPFRLLMHANPKGFMTSYNRLNGTHAAEHPWLLRTLLRGEWGFDGLIMSDWSGTYSSADSIKAGMDLEMPGPVMMRGDCTQRDILGGKLTIPDVEDCTKRVLAFIKEAMDSGIGFEKDEESIDTPAVRSLLREAACAGVVLLKNDANVLPLKPESVQGRKIAVIGPNAGIAAISGGGSASLRATYAVTPLDAIKEEVQKLGGTISGFERGCTTDRWMPLLSDFVYVPRTNEMGVHVEFFESDPFGDEKGTVAPIFERNYGSSLTYFIDNIPKSIPVRGWVRWSTTFRPNESGIWEIGLGVAGQADLYFDGKLLIENSKDQKFGLLFFGTGAEEQVAEVHVEAGKLYDIEVRFSNFKQLSPNSPYAGRRGGIRVGGRKKRNVKAMINNAVALSKSSDVTILVIGTTAEWESESYDRTDIKLPGETDQLVDAILSANPNAIIVHQSGMPSEFPWISKCSTLLQAFYGGNECGHAISDCIFGVHNPSGKLPVTFPKVLQDYPSHEGFGHDFDTVYSEGIKVGYRYFDRPGGPQSAFPFGFGLSYTSFSFKNIKVSPSEDFDLGLKVEFDVKNTGLFDGAEAAQVYVHAVNPKVERPEVELKGMRKVFLKSGEERRVSVQLDHSAFSYYDVQTKAWIGEAGDFEIRVGPSSVQFALIAPFHLERSFSWTGLKKPSVL